MNQPISYYCPGDYYPVLQEVEQEWGSFYEKCSQDEKLWLLANLSRFTWVNNAETHSVRPGIANAAARMNSELPLDVKLALIEGLINQFEL